MCNRMFAGSSRTVRALSADMSTRFTAVSVALRGCRRGFPWVSPSAAVSGQSPGAPPPFAHRRSSPPPPPPTAPRVSGWTGYFTSRPGVKGYVRETSSYHQAARQLQFAAGGATSAGPTNPLYQLETTMGVVQHHDAVSGTEKQHVRAATPGSRGGGAAGGGEYVACADRA
jgi:hypothetical protein